MNWGLTVLDWAALALFALCWLGYEPALGVLGRRRGSINTDMLTVRRAWMRAMARRDMRLVDSQLMGHSINSASFFASANLLLIAAVAGVLFGDEATLRSIAAVGDANASLRALEIKMAMITLCLARGFLDFIWAIRQLNYTLALLGAAPEPGEAIDPEAYADAAVTVLNPALAFFNRGVRAYYFALAAAIWLFGPAWLALGAMAAFTLLLSRQAASPTARGIRAARALIESASTSPSQGEKPTPPEDRRERKPGF